MGLFSAGSETQLETIKRWIDDSDIYMLLLGGRYGSIEPSSGLSYTEVEYRYALENNKPFFALVMDEEMLNEKVAKEGKEVLELNEPKKYRAFKELVLSKISKFFTNSDKIQLGVWQSLVDIERRYTLNGWVKASEGVDSAKVLNQLTDLSERNKQLEEQVAFFKSQIESKEDSDTILQLSEEAKELLMAAYSAKKDGEILHMSRQDRLRVDNKWFPSDPTARNIAIWKDALTQLARINIVERRRTTGENDIYALTKYGFEIGDHMTKTAN